MADKKAVAIVAQGLKALSNCSPELACQFFERAIQIRPEDTDAIDLLAEAQVQAGKVDEARTSLLKSISINPSANPAKWFLLAQLQQASEAVATFRQGITYISSNSTIPEAIRRKQISKALASIAELYLTDLCFEDDAEAACEAAVTQALEADPTCLDARLALSSLRLSQSRPQEACIAATELLGVVMTLRDQQGARTLAQELQDTPEDTETEDVESDFCVSLAKVLLECAPSAPALYQGALELLYDLLEEDDEQAEVWLLAGVALASFIDPSADPRPDVGAAKTHLERALQLFERVRAEMIPGEEFVYAEQYSQVQEHLTALAAGRPLRLGAAHQQGEDGAMSIADDAEWSDEEKDKVDEG